MIWSQEVSTENSAEENPTKEVKGVDSGVRRKLLFSRV